jgi:hypothetical protein
MGIPPNNLATARRRLAQGCSDRQTTFFEKTKKKFDMRKRLRIVSRDSVSEIKPKEQP